MKKTFIIMAMAILMGATAANAQECCKDKKQECCQSGEKKDCCQAGEKQECCQAGEKRECCQNMIIENIMTRTSIRKYKAKPVEDAKIETMLRAAMAAPTAVNKQPWHFVVVTDKEMLNKLAGEGRRGDMLRNAPLAIVVCGDMSKALEGKGREYWIQDTSAATENLLLAAHALGLGAVWTGQWPMEDRYQHTMKVLGMPDTIIPLGTMIIGYPDEQPTPKDKWKPENVSYNQYGGK